MALQTRDLILLLIAAVIALVSFHWQASYELEKMAPISIRSTSSNSEFYNIPEPIIVDHGQGKVNDVILAFDRSVGVFRFQRKNDVLKEISRWPTAHQPLLMTFLSPSKHMAGYKPEHNQPFLIVLTSEDFKLTCLRFPSLEVVWSIRVPQIAKHYLKFDNLALSDHSMIADYTPIYKGDVGAIFLTLKFDNVFDHAQSEGTEEGTLNNYDLEHEHDKKNIHDESMNLDKSDMRSLEILTHSIFFAFDLTSGALRWQHTSEDEHSRQSLHDIDAEAVEDDQEEMGETAHEYKRHLAEKSQHFEETDWHIFKQSFLNTALPHQWFHSRHTSLSTEHFDPPSSTTTGARDRINNKDDVTYLQTSKTSNQGKFDYRTSYKYMRQANNENHDPSKPKNVLLYQNSDGITVIHLYTGRVLTRLPLPSYRTYADINGDSMIDSVFVDEQDGMLHLNTMYQEERGSSLLYQLPLYGSNSFYSSIKDYSKKDITFSPPLLIAANVKFGSSNNGENGIIGSALSKILPQIDQSNTIKSEKGYYIMLMDSMGTMYCVRGDYGRLQWKVDTGAGWHFLQSIQQRINLDILNLEKTKQNDPVVLRRSSLMDKKALNAVMFPYSIETASRTPSGVMSITPSAIVLVDPTGRVLALESTHLPSISTSTLPIVADLTNDGRNDVIISTNTAYHIFIMSSGASHVHPLLAAIFLLVLILIAGIQLLKYSKEKKLN